jgi:hypothetical protein
MLPTKFRFIWPSGFGGEDLKKSANQKQEMPVAAMFVNWSGQNEKSLETRGPSIDASYQVSIHLAERFQRRLKCENLTDDGCQVMAKAKKDKQWSTKHTHKIKDRVTRTPLKTGGELRCYRRVNNSCSTSSTRHVNLGDKSWMGKGPGMLTTNVGGCMYIYEKF